MSSTAITVKNTSDQTCLIALKLGGTYGELALEPGQQGSMGCEWVWYTVNAYTSGTPTFITHKSGVYGGSHLVFDGSEITKTKGSDAEAPEVVAAR